MFSGGTHQHFNKAETEKIDEFDEGISTQPQRSFGSTVECGIQQKFADSYLSRHSPQLSRMRVRTISQSWES